MYFVKFEDEKDMMAICAESFEVNSLYAVFKDEKGVEVALLKMDKVRGILKKDAIDIVS